MQRFIEGADREQACGLFYRLVEFTEKLNYYIAWTQKKINKVLVVNLVFEVGSFECTN